MRPDDLGDLFRSVPQFRSRRMFGGYGLYDDDTIIALIVSDTLFLKTDAGTAPLFLAAGAQPFVYESAGRRPVTMPYHSCPDEAFDDPDAADHWIGLARAAGQRAALKAPRRRATG